MLGNKRLDGWTKRFLITTVATSVTGFFFPFHGFTPAIALGIMSLLVLAVAILARYPRQLSGHWRWIYVVTAHGRALPQRLRRSGAGVRKNTGLKAMAPTQTEPPFKLTQLIVLALFILLGILAAITFRPEPARLA